MNAYSDISPTTPSRGSVYGLARRVREAAQAAMEHAIDGPHCDVPLAMQHLERARAILGMVDDERGGQR